MGDGGDSEFVEAVAGDAGEGEVGQACHGAGLREEPVGDEVLAAGFDMVLELGAEVVGVVDEDRQATLRYSSGERPGLNFAASESKRGARVGSQSRARLIFAVEPVATCNSAINHREPLLDAASVNGVRFEHCFQIFEFDRRWELVRLLFQECDESDDDRLIPIPRPLLVDGEMKQRFARHARYHVSLWPIILQKFEPAELPERRQSGRLAQANLQRLGQPVGSRIGRRHSPTLGSPSCPA